MKQKHAQTFNVIHPDAAGIDVSSKDYYVAVPPDRDQISVRQFGSFTQDLQSIVDWLFKCKITSIAMESTGVYWVQLFMVLQDHGFEVFLVNAKQIKNVSGKKTDVSDCQWIQQLHTFGLLSNSFQPDNVTKELRTYVRQRKSLTEAASKEVLRIQKSMTLMNIKLDKVISDIMGKSGKQILMAILEGERDANVLVSLADSRLKASKEDLIKSLEADWRNEHLFTLRQSFELYEFNQTKIKECDLEIERILNHFACKEIKGPKTESKNPYKKKQKQKTDFSFDPQNQLIRIYGIDVTQIPGLSSVTAVTILSETGNDLRTNFSTQKRFVSWLNLAPNNKITGGKVISSKVKKKKNKAGQSFRFAANALKESHCPIGEYFRKVKSREGHGRAIIATANKLAGLFYKLVTEQKEFNYDEYLKARSNTLIKQLTRLNKRVIVIQNQILQASGNFEFIST